MPTFISVSGKVHPAPRATFHYDQVVDITKRQDGSYLLRNHDGKQMVSSDKSISHFAEKDFLRLGNRGVWVNPNLVLVAIAAKRVFLSKVRSRDCAVSYAKSLAALTPLLIESAQLNEINPTTFVRLTAASQVTPGGVLSVCGETYTVERRLRDGLIRKVKAIGWLKLKNGTFVNPFDFSLLYEFESADGWITTRYGRTLRPGDFRPEEFAKVKASVPWVRIEACFVNPGTIHYLDPENLAVPCDDHALGVNKEQFDKLKKLIDPRLVHPLRYD